jgi:hypothetical protein
MSLAAMAAQRADVQCLHLLLARGVELGGFISLMSASYGSLACLRLARESGDTWDFRVAVVAACNGTQSLCYSHFKNNLGVFCCLGQVSNPSARLPVVTVSSKEPVN